MTAPPLVSFSPIFSVLYNSSSLALAQCPLSYTSASATVSDCPLTLVVTETYSTGVAQCPLRLLQPGVLLPVSSTSPPALDLLVPCPPLLLQHQCTRNPLTPRLRLPRQLQPRCPLAQYPMFSMSPTTLDPLL